VQRRQDEGIVHADRRAQLRQRRLFLFDRHDAGADSELHAETRLQPIQQRVPVFALARRQIGRGLGAIAQKIVGIGEDLADDMIFLAGDAVDRGVGKLG